MTVSVWCAVNELPTVSTDIAHTRAIHVRDERCTEMVSQCFINANAMQMAWPFVHCNLDIAGFFYKLELILIDYS